MTLPDALERLAGQLHDATASRARSRTRQRQLRLFAISLAVLTVVSSAAVASGWLGGRPAPASVKLALMRELATSTPQVRSIVGTPIAKEAILAASLDSHHFVWGVPTTTGGYCVGLTQPLRAVDGMGCSGASAGMWSSYYDCDGSVIFGGRINNAATSSATVIEIRHDGRTLRVPIHPSNHGFFIIRLPAAFFRDVRPHAPSTWPRTAVLDADHRLASPARDNSGRMPPPAHPRCFA